MVALNSAIVLLVLAAWQQPATSSPPAPMIGLEGCKTSCGKVGVPYPFGLGPARCYWPGFNLTCHRSGRGPPRLLLGDGTLEVISICVTTMIPTVRVIGTGPIVDDSTPANSTSEGLSSSSFGASFAGSIYTLFTLRNELFLFGCNLTVMLVEGVGERNPKISAGCTSICSPDLCKYKGIVEDKLCFGVGCCQADIAVAPRNYSDFLRGVPNAVKLRWQGPNNHIDFHKSPWHVFVAEKEWFDKHSKLTKADTQNGLRSERAAGLRVPFLLRWGAQPGKAGLPKPYSSGPKKHRQSCPGNTSRVLCRSDHTECVSLSYGYFCRCLKGYGGNPYLPGAGGCRGLVIGIAIGSGVGSILYVLLAMFVTQRFKHLRAKKLKQKYFKQNHGQLLEHLVSQNTVIAERMIIPVDELAKATNNFDKARELGGGGHGTVYKGILSDQHVVAIKKSNITVQREINEFLNEVAILSQINHRNIVKLFGCCLETEVPLLVYEFISNGTLYQHLHVEGPRQLPWGLRLRIAVETSSALAYLHSSVSMPIIHRDIKSSNILLDDTLTAKVSDFGASRYIPIEKAGLTTRVQGTIGYLDPMYFYTGRLTEKSDVYSFGVMLVELLTRKKPFSYLSLDDESLVSHFVNLLDQDNLVQILDPQVVEEGDEEVHEVAILAASCIKLTGEDRPRMQQVEHALKGIAARRIEENGIAAVNCSSQTKEGKRSKVSSRRYSMEQEFLLSASFPR
ncbi:hypothetical protein PVAP13_8KG333900 [Panicum virgatum]|uniref:Protein kinase domain-containing protein n=1 Tax=Panicum virgatum TaxID=38727 RepID=A0A8T0PQ29_PANVG|nr:hypothetical protein PVAP13_8KG333900 [Panicum virgatum]